MTDILTNTGVIIDPINTADVFGGRFEELFRQQLEPLYGDQSSALSRIANGEDRTAYVIGCTANPLGVLVIKDTVTTEEYKAVTVRGVEIKTLTLFNPDQNSGRGLASRLIEKAVGHCQEIDPESPIFVTVASDKPESRAFFTKHGFKIVTEVNGAYRIDNAEAVMVADAKRIIEC